MPSVQALDANSAKQSFSVAVDDNAQPMARVSLDDTMPTYRASAQFTPQPTAAVTVLSIQGAQNKTVRIKRITVGGHSTANAQESFALQRTSALGAGGAAVVPVVAKMDTNKPAATAVVQHYTTSLKAAGTAVGGPLVTADVLTGVVTTPTIPTGPTTLFPEQGAPVGSAIVLRGAADFLELQNINAGNLSAGTVLNYTVEWTEDAS